VAEAALSEHVCAIHESADGEREILWLASDHIREQVPDDTAVVGVAPRKGPELLEI
jgi:hypothetical protein